MASFQRSIREIVRDCSRLLAVYVSEKWKALEILCRGQPEGTLPRVATSDWFPAPRARELAAMSDLIREERPELYKPYAALVQRCCFLDPNACESLTELGSCDHLPGWTSTYALQIREDLDHLLDGGALEEVECCPEDLFSVLCGRFFSQRLDRDESPRLAREMAVMNRLLLSSGEVAPPDSCCARTMEPREWSHFAKGGLRPCHGSPAT